MQNELEDDLQIKGKRLLSDIYQRCNVAIYEPASCEEALKDPKWKIAMGEEMSMIHKNKTWELVERPEDRKWGLICGHTESSTRLMLNVFLNQC